MKKILLTFLLLLAFLGSRAQINDLPRCTPEEMGVRSEAVHMLFDSLMALPHTDIHSVMVLRGGKVIGEMYPAPFGPEYKHTMYSASKTFTAAAVGLAIEEGKLKLDDKVIDFFPHEVPAEVSHHLKEMTVRDLLTMSSGIKPDWEMRNHTEHWIATWLAKPVEKPGEKFEYDSICTYLLSAIVQKVTGETVLQLLQNKVFDEMHIVDVDWEESPEGYNTGGWGLHIQPESLAKFGQLLLDGGKWHGKQLLPANWVHEMEKLQIKTGTDNDYGYQMWLCDYPGAVRADGAYGQYILIIPSKDMVVVITECSLIGGKPQRELVWKRLMPHVGRNALPNNREGHLKLEEASKAYSLPQPPGTAESPKRHALYGKDLHLGHNSYGFKDIKLNGEGDILDMTLSYRDGKPADVIRMEHGLWSKPVKSEQHPPYSVMAVDRFKGIRPPFDICAAYAWDPIGRLQVKTHYVNWISALYFVIDPEKKVVEIRNNYSEDVERVPFTY